MAKIEGLSHELARSNPADSAQKMAKIEGLRGVVTQIVTLKVTNSNPELERKGDATMVFLCIKHDIE